MQFLSGFPYQFSLKVGQVFEKRCCILEALAPELYFSWVTEDCQARNNHCNYIVRQSRALGSIARSILDQIFV